MPKLWNLKQVAVGLVVGAIALAYATTPAEAAFLLKITDGTNTVTVTGSGGFVQYACGGPAPACPFTGWSVDVTTGLSDPLTLPLYPDMDLNFTNVSNGTGSTLTMSMTEDGFTTNPAVYTGQYGGTTTTATTTASAYRDNGNVDFALTTPLFSIGPLSGAFAGSGYSGYFNVPGPYSITQVITISPTIGKNSGNFDLSTTIPEPASMTLLGTGLVVLASRARRKSRRAQA